LTRCPDEDRFPSLENALAITREAGDATPALSMASLRHAHGESSSIRAGKPGVSASFSAIPSRSDKDVDFDQILLSGTVIF